MMTPIKWVWFHCLLLYISVRKIASVDIQFGSRETTCSAGHQCMSILDCALYQSRAAIARSRPTPCGFSYKTPLVCCPATNTTILEPRTHENLLNLLPSECGGPKRASFDPTPPCPEGFDEDTPCVFFAFNGYDALKGKWPWVVLLGRWSEEGELGRWFCGGTLITDRHVLTAAHCLQPQQVGSVGARLGEYDLSTASELIHQDRNITRITRHEEYRGSQNDIAVLLLERPFDPSPTIRPICLPPAGAEHDGQDVDMAGWGLLEFDGDVPAILQEAPLRVSDVVACEQSHSRLPSFRTRFADGFQGTKVCALSRDDQPRDACRGDSGGPLMTQRPGGLYELVGVVAGGVGCGNPAFPGIYTKVSAYIDWILRNLM